MVRAFFCAGISRAVLFSNVREKFRPAREKENGEGPSPPAEASLHPEEIQGSPPPSKGGNSSEGRKGRKERRRVFCRPLLVGGERGKKSYRKRGYYLIILFSPSSPLLLFSSLSPFESDETCFRIDLPWRRGWGRKKEEEEEV